MKAEERVGRLLGRYKASPECLESDSRTHIKGGAESLLHTQATGTVILQQLPKRRPVMVEHCSDPSSLEAEAGGLLGVQGEPELHGEYWVTV